MPWTVIYFPPVERFIRGLPESLRMKVLSNIDLLELYGPNLRAPVVKKIMNKIYELRIQGENSMRLFYTFHKGKFYLLHIFRKKSQKLPHKEIKVALDRIKNII